MEITKNLNEVEDNLLKLLLTQPDLQGYIFENCEDVFFENILNRKIFQTGKELFDNGKLVDNVGVYQLTTGKDINQRLSEILIDTIAYPFAARNYCEALFDNYVGKLIQSARGKEDLDHIKEMQLKYSFEDSKIKGIGDEIKDAEERYNKRQDQMLLTGWGEFDNYIGSFCGGDYIALGGSTGTGKTSIALNIAKNLCIQNKSVLYCSLEMPLEQLQNRFNCMVTGLNALKYRSCGFTKEEFEAYKRGLETLNQWKLSVLCDYNLTVEKLRYYITEKKKTGLDFVIIDYLGLMSGYGNKSLYEKSTMISRQLKILATEFDIPILVLVQLNRDAKNRQDKRPVLSDIRESGAIEQDADYVLFAYRDYVYSQDTFKENELEIIIAKNRHGESNKFCKFDFDLKSQNINVRKFNYGYNV